MKEYSNPSRKPMMYGGEGTMKRMKRQAGSSGTGERQARDAMANADAQSRVATGRATAKDKEAMEAQRREELSRMSTPDLKKIANGSSNDALTAVSILRERGEPGSMPMGDQEPAGKMYGGKAKKK